MSLVVFFLFLLLFWLPHTSLSLSLYLSLTLSFSLYIYIYIFLTLSISHSLTDDICLYHSSYTDCPFLPGHLYCRITMTSTDRRGFIIFISLLFTVFFPLRVLLCNRKLYTFIKLKRIKRYPVMWWYHIQWGSFKLWFFRTGSTPVQNVSRTFRIY